MSSPVVEQTCFSVVKRCEGGGKEAAKPTSSLAGSFTPLSSHTISSTSFCVLPITLPTQTHTCTSLFSPIYPFPLSTTAGCLWVQAQSRHLDGKVTGGISPFPSSCHDALLQNASPLLPLSHLHPHLCPHRSSSKLHQAHWQGRTVADSRAATADHVLQEQLRSDTGRESNPAAGAKVRGTRPPSPSSLHRTCRVQLLLR